MQRPSLAPRASKGAVRAATRALAIIATVLYASVRSASAGVSVGTSGGGFLDFEVGGRSAGMGGAQLSTATGVTAQYWNPSGLAGIDQTQVGAMHANWLDNLSYDWVGYARPLGPRIGVGSLSVAYFHMPGIQGVDEFDNPTQMYKVYDLAVTAGLARPVSRHVSLGANVRMIRQSLATVTANGVAVDLGATGRFGTTAVAAVVQNFGPSLSYDGASYPLPRQLRFGASHSFIGEKLLLAADYNMPRDYFNDTRIGAEYRIHPLVSLRAGYRLVLGSSNDPGTGFSYGLGLHVKQLSLDYAMTPSDGFDNVHRLGLGYSFGGGPEEPETKPEPPKKETPLPPPPPKGPTVTASVKPKREAKPAEPVRVLADATSAAAPQTTVATTASASEATKTSKTSEITTVKPAETPTPSRPAVTAPSSGTTASPAPKSKPAEKPAKQQAKAVSNEYAIVLPGFQSKDSAQAELKALQLLGFRIKDAVIEEDAKNGVSIRLAKMKSKDSADEMVTSLSRMSFRAVVQMVQR